MVPNLGSRIKKLRLKKGISQDGLSKTADMAVNTITKIETGKEQNPKIQAPRKIAEALDISINNLPGFPLS